MIHRDIEQYSDEWWELRAGRFTASQASKLLTPTGKLSTQYKGELGRLIAEAIGLQEPDRETFSTEWMDRGSEMEGEALAWLAVDQDCDPEIVGMVTDGSHVIGASPDAILPDFVDRGGNQRYAPVELKVPKPSTHIEWLLDGGLPKQHKAQLHFQMAVMNARWGIFMSYNPDLEPLCVTVQADDYTRAMEDAIAKFKEDYVSAYVRIVGTSPTTGEDE
jgi:hypothetical protein